MIRVPYFIPENKQPPCEKIQSHNASTAFKLKQSLRVYFCEKYRRFFGRVMFPLMFTPQMTKIDTFSQRTSSNDGQQTTLLGQCDLAPNPSAST
jgi:hypothetical protein